MTVTIPMSIDEYKVVHLSDLHFTGRPNEELNGIWQFFSTEEISSANLKILFDDIVTINPDHIFITGDITNTAHPIEFHKAKEWLLGLQNKLKPNLGQGTIELLPELFTIIPGNHDVSVKPSWFRRQKAEASRLKLFIETFGSTLNLTNHSNIYDFQEAFPTYKKLFDVVQVFSTNTTVDIPVHIVGFNASGEIGEQQRKRLFDKLNDLRDEHSYRIVLCHHHPLIIPYRLGSDIAEKFLAMKDSRKFLRVCFDMGVHLVLHGHKHHPFIWQNEIIPELDPPHQMRVICAGSPTFARAGSSQVYNRYIMIRKRLGSRITLQKVDMITRRYDPIQKRFKDVNSKPVNLYEEFVNPESRTEDPTINESDKWKDKEKPYRMNKTDLPGGGKKDKSD